MQKVPRKVYFNKGFCVAVGPSGEVTEHDLSLILPLPTDHYDFAGPLADQIKGMSIIAVINILYTEREFFTTEEKDRISGTFARLSGDRIAGDLWVRDV